MKIISLAACLIPLSLATGTALAAPASEILSINDAYVRAVPPMQPNSAAFFTIANADTEAHAIVSASSPAAKKVELHTHIMENDVARMREVAKIDVPAQGQTTLKPGGLHVMLLGLHKQLVPGDEVSLTLHFADGTQSTLKAPVRKIKVMMHGAHQGMHKMK